jgi:DNA-binding transcriptional LysR family regulator
MCLSSYAQASASRAAKSNNKLCSQLSRCEIVASMELRHLEYFVTVADERSFTRAAEQLHVVQSGVSSGVKALEREMGTALFERTSRRVSLTSAGTALLPKARSALDAARDARDAVDAVRGGLGGVLRIGALSSLVSLVDIPALLGRFHERHPAVRIELITNAHGSAGLLEQLLAAELDVALVSLPDGVPPQIVEHVVISRPLQLVVPTGHHLEDRKAVRLDQLADEPFIDCPEGWGIRSVVDHAFKAAGVSRTVSHEVTDIGLAADLVRHQLGVAILPEFAAHNGAGLRTIEICDVALRWPLAVVTSDTRTVRAPAATLIQQLSERLR